MKLEYRTLLSNFAVNFNLHRYVEGSPSTQIAVAVLLFSCNIAAHSYARPFRKPDMDQADAVALLATTFYLVLAMVFSSSQEMESSQHAAVGVVTLVGTVG